MNEPDALTIVGVLSTNWDREQWTEAKVELWCRELAPFAATDGMDAALDCVRSMDWPPKIADFLTTVRAKARRSKEAEQAHLRALPAPQGSLSPGEQIARMRQMLANADRSGEHDHHKGAAGCPVCSLRMHPGHTGPNCPTCTERQTRAAEGVR